MSASPLPPDVVAFLQGHIGSLLQLEALLLVFESDDEPRTAADLSAEMYVPAEALKTWLDDFAESGFCGRDGEGYTAPEDPENIKLLGEVSQAYVRRPVSVGRLIFGATRDDLVQLSDAFRLRKDR